MADEEKVDPTTEKKDDGGETGDKQTTGKTPAELEQIAKDQRKRAENAEADKKVLEEKLKAAQKPPEPEPKSNNATQLDPIELAKTANVLSGMADVEIENLQLIAKAKNVTLAEAKKDPLFQTWQAKFLEDAKREQAKLGGSRSSDQGDPESQSPIKPNMSRADHQKVVAELLGK